MRRHGWAGSLVCLALTCGSARSTDCASPGTKTVLMLGQQSFNGAPSKPVAIEVHAGDPTGIVLLDTEGRLQMTQSYSGQLAIAGHNALTGDDLRYVYKTISGAPWGLDVGAVAVYRREFLIEDALVDDEQITQTIAGRSTVTIGDCTVPVLEVNLSLTSNLTGSRTAIEKLYAPTLGYAVAIHLVETTNGRTARQDFTVTAFHTR